MSVTVALLGIQLVIAIQSLGLLGAEHADLRGECPYGSRHGIIRHWAQDDMIAAIFGDDRSGMPPLAHRRGDGDLASTRYRKALCHGHYNLP
jgi:hypothetical protein